jgi:tRNA-dihydrouridine synthase B
MQRSDMRAFYAAHPLILAPMAGVTDPVFRQLCREQGASLAFTEMVSAKGLSYRNGKTAELLDLGPGEDCVGVQLFGHEPDTMAAEAAWIVRQMGSALAVVDINMGCPAKKIVTKGDGASLMQRPDEAAAIVEAVVHALDGSGVPVTVKFRRGFDEGCETAPEFARRMEQAGAWGMTVHGRYARQMYRGRSDDGAVARVVDAVDVPVVGNGDVDSPARAVELQRATGCAALMIARGAEGNPWIFAQCAAALDGRPVPPEPSYEERLACAARHARLLERAEGARIVKMRKHAMWYLKGIPGAAEARRRFNDCVSADDFCAVLADMEAHLAQRAVEAPQAPADAAAGAVGGAAFGAAVGENGKGEAQDGDE